MIKKFKGYPLEYLSNDIISGITVAALCIPVAMGYAQIAGLPPIYGLYVSILPVVAYALFSSSPQLIFGVDSSSAAIAGSLVVTAGIMTGSEDALAFIALVSGFTGLFMLAFSLAKLGRFSVYVSEPVMSGAIFGISLSVMLSQIPKILGIKSQGSEVTDTIEAIVSQFSEINFLSLVIGVISIAIILIGKRYSNKIPFPIIVLIVATILSGLLKFDSFNVSIIGSIPKGFPPLKIPAMLASDKMVFALLGGFLSSIVLSMDSLLTSKSFANKNGYILDDNKEIFAFGISNVVSAFSGFLPTSASVSRTAANEQFKGKTQLVSIISAMIITLVLLFFSQMLYFMPQPALSGIVFAALAGVILSELRTLKDVMILSHKEGIVWLVSMFLVLVFGILIGIVCGVILSFILIIVTNTNKSSAFLGAIPTDNSAYYYDLNRNEKARPVPGVLIYRYSNSLFFTNVDAFIGELEAAISDDTTKIIIDAHAITTIDTSAVKKLKKFLTKLQESGIAYYFASTIGDFRDTVRNKGLTKEINESHFVLTIDEAIKKDGGNYYE